VFVDPGVLQIDLRIKKIRRDNDTKFKNLQVKEYLEEEHIKHGFFAPYTPQQNGVVERKNRTLNDKLVFFEAAACLNRRREACVTELAGSTVAQRL
jgi:transposase InsO family protein